MCARMQANGVRVYNKEHCSYPGERRIEKYARQQLILPLSLTCTQHRHRHPFTAANSKRQELNKILSIWLQVRRQALRRHILQATLEIVARSFKNDIVPFLLRKQIKFRWSSFVRLHHGNRTVYWKLCMRGGRGRTKLWCKYLRLFLGW